MKKYLFVIILAFLTGSILAWYVLNNSSAFAKEKYEVYLFQVGVFNNMENAKKKESEFASSKIILIGDYYHVYSNIFTSTELKEKMEEYYLSSDKTFFVKKIEVDSNLYNELKKYEKLINVDSDYKTIGKVSLQMMSIYEDSLYEE